MRSPLRSFRHTALALAGAAALAGPAQAALVQGDWDPPYGLPFPELGWRGTATIDVPTACLALSGTVLNSGSLCPLITVVNAEVGFYDVDVPAMTVETLDFDSLVSVDRIFINDGVVEAFALTSTGRVLSTSPLGVTVPGGEQAFFALEIDFVIGAETEAVLRWGGNLRGPLGGRNDPDFPAIVDIRQLGAPPAVPVPATLGLALAGLALLGALRRR